MLGNLEEVLERALNVLTHPTRRAILQSLWMRDLSFIELSETLVADHGKLGQHLRRMKGLVEHRRGERVFGLTDEGRLLYKCFSRFLLEYAKQRSDLEVPRRCNPFRHIEKLYLGDHAIQFYEDSTLKWLVLNQYLKTGILRGFAAIYFASEKEMGKVEKEVEKWDLAMEKREAEAFSIMSAKEWYLLRSEASADKIIREFSKLVKEKMEAGYKGLQVASEMNDFLYNAGIREVIAYEKRLGQKLSLTFCALCIYKPEGLQPEQFKQLLQAHGHAVFPGIAVNLLGEA